MQKFICKLPKCFANCKLQTVNLNLELLSMPLKVGITKIGIRWSTPVVSKGRDCCEQYGGNMVTLGG